MDAVLSIRDVAVSYGKKQVLHGINLDIASGETFGLIGLNGAGKTTLIKTILGLRDPQGGNISIGGHDRLHKESRMQLAFLPERFDPPLFLNGMEFLKFSAGFYKRPFSEDEARDHARMLALDPDALPRRVNTYSKGMRQKLGLMATLLTGCRLLILDEPMSGLDPLARQLVKNALLATKSKGHTVFLSSHILSDMSEICDRVAVMDQGRLVYTGTPAGLLKGGNDPNIEKAFLNLIGRSAQAA